MNDPFALLAVTTLLSVMMLGIVWSLRRSGQPGVTQWWYCALTAIGALTLFTLRGRITDVLAVVVANGALAWALALFYAGTLRFCGREPPWRRLVACTLAVMGGIVTWRYIFQDFNTRVVIVSAFHAWFCAATGVALVRYRPRGRATSHHLTTAGFAFFFAAAHTLRGVLSALAVMDDPATMASPGLNAGFLVVGALAIPALSMGAVLMVHDAMVRRLETIANTDFLTGVLSRKAFEDEAGRELARAARGGRAPVLLIVDIDHFKAVNDTFGHATGDAVLAEFARLAAASLRAPDRIGRMGGEEFVVLLPACSLDDARHAAERIRAQAEASHVGHASNTGNASRPPDSVRYTVSGGYAAWQPGETLAQLMARADAALYMAKLSGRNRMLPDAAGIQAPAPVGMASR
ncbi:GGDEF domain-containing protein [Cupriavidus sp. 2TAF22]|uniref:GGDEF domain-containing protein n=1 Tax=unclassified Cupriavidus TaxID=2640874 RepID=UPI003F90D59C